MSYITPTLSRSPSCFAERPLNNQAVQLSVSHVYTGGFLAYGGNSL